MRLSSDHFGPNLRRSGFLCVVTICRFVRQSKPHVKKSIAAMSDVADIADMEYGTLPFRKTKKSQTRYTFRADSDVQCLLAKALRDFPDISKTINAALRSGLKSYERKSA